MSPLRFVFFLIALASATEARATEPSFQGLGNLPGGDFASLAGGVSADGSTVVGGSVSSADPSSIEAFRWTAVDGMMGLGDLGLALVQSFARGVSADGSVIVGKATPDSTFRNAPFVWTTSAGMVELHDPTGEIFAGEANDVSDDGSVIVGVGVSAAGNQAFRWTASTGMVGLGWLPATILDSFAFGTSAEGSIVCGISFSGPQFDVEPFRWTESEGMVGLGDVPGGIFYAIAEDVSGDGTTIVGNARTSFGSRDEMFIWRQDTGFILPDSLHGADFSSSAQAISDDGSIVVGGGEFGAMIWDAAHGMRNLQDILTNDFGLDLTGWILGTATGISSDGSTIVGSGLNPSRDSEAWIAHIPPVTVGAPEPEALRHLELVPAGPNPFFSRVAFRLVVSGRTRHVRAGVYSIDGRLVRELMDRVLPAGVHPVVWDDPAVHFPPAASGVYILSVKSEEQSITRKLVHLR